jgi:hypothetical protein
MLSLWRRHLAAKVMSFLEAEAEKKAVKKGSVLVATLVATPFV